MASARRPSEARSSASTGCVVPGVDDDGRERVVLGGGADHGGAADVDVLDRLGGARVAACDRALEGVEVDAYEVDRLDFMLGGCAQVLVLVAQGEQAGVEAWVQRLYASIHHLRKAGEVLDRAHRQPGSGRARERCRRSRRSRRRARSARGRSPRCRPCRRPRAARGAPVRRPLLCAAGRSARSSRMTRLESTHRVRLPARIPAGARCRGRARRSLPAREHPTRILRVTAERAAGEQAHGLAVATCAPAGAAPPVPPRRLRAASSSRARCRITGPLSTPASTKCTVTPKTLTP